MSFLGAVGGYVWRQARDVRYLAAMLGALLFYGMKPSSWPRTVRGAFARQILFSGVESLRFVCVMAVLVGISVVVQAQVWVERVGQSQLLGPLLVVVVARELGPLFANFVVIVKSGSAITTELGVMKVFGEVRVLESQGIAPFLFLVMPRVFGVAVSAFCLAIVFIVSAFLSGYLFGVFIGEATVNPTNFLNSVFRSIHLVDMVNIVAKSILPALLTSAICSLEGLSVGMSVVEVPMAAQRALGRSLGALFFSSVLISIVTYF